MKRLFFISIVLMYSFVFAQHCDKCKGKGVIEATIQCPLCCGYGNLSPAWFNLEVGNTRWTETTYWTGLQTKSDYRHKMFSFKACPMCKRSKRPGSITWIHICACPMGENAKMKAFAKSARDKVKSKCKQMGVKTEGLDTGDDEYAINLAAWMVRWQLPPKLYKKLLHEVVNNEFDKKDAHYKREESKYTEKKFRNDEEQDIPKGSRMAKNSKDDSDSDDDKDMDKDDSSEKIDTNGMSPTILKARMVEMRLKPVTFNNCTIKIDDDYSGEFFKMENYYWSVFIRVDPDDANEIFHGYVKKTSSVGKELFKLLSDGKKHEGVKLTLMYSKKAEYPTCIGIVEIK